MLLSLLLLLLLLLLFASKYQQNSRFKWIQLLLEVSFSLFFGDKKRRVNSPALLFQPKMCPNIKAQPAHYLCCTSRAPPAAAKQCDCPPQWAAIVRHCIGGDGNGNGQSEQASTLCFSRWSARSMMMVMMMTLSGNTRWKRRGERGENARGETRPGDRRRERPLTSLTQWGESQDHTTTYHGIVQGQGKQANKIRKEENDSNGEREEK